MIFRRGKERLFEFDTLILIAKTTVKIHFIQFYFNQFFSGINLDSNLTLFKLIITLLDTFKLRFLLKNNFSKILV